MDYARDLGPEELHRRGRELLERGHGGEAFEHLSRAYLLDPQNPRFRASYALALALVKGQFLGAAELARAAVRQEFYNPDLYLDLARIYLAFGMKAEGIRYLRRGLMIDPAHEALQSELRRLGVRRRPPIRFLPRHHPLNRWLGKLRYRLLAGRAARVPATAASA